MTWAHVTEEGIIDWTSHVEQEGLIQLDLPVLEEGERLRVVGGAAAVEKEDAGEAADAVLSSFVAEIEEAQAEQAKPPPLSPMLLFRLLDPNTALPASLFHGWSCPQAHEFAGDFGDWAFLNCEPTEKQKAFISDYCRGRSFDALFLTCPYHGQRVSFSDILVGTDKAMLHKDVLAELEAAGIATSGIEFRAALFKGYCIAHCGVFLNDGLEKAVPDEAAAASLADAALSLLEAGEEVRSALAIGGSLPPAEPQASAEGEAENGG